MTARKQIQYKTKEAAYQAAMAGHIDYAELEKQNRRLEGEPTTRDYITESGKDAADSREGRRARTIAGRSNYAMTGYHGRPAGAVFDLTSKASNCSVEVYAIQPRKGFRKHTDGKTTPDICDLFIATRISAGGKYAKAKRQRYTGMVDQHGIRVSGKASKAKVIRALLEFDWFDVAEEMPGRVERRVRIGSVQRALERLGYMPTSEL